MIWQVAGIIGVDPSPFTLRELLLMAEARRNEDWSHTAAIMALIANVNRNPKKRSRPYTPAEFHPLVQRKPVTPSKAGVRVLKDVFVKQAGGRRPETGGKRACHDVP